MIDRLWNLVIIAAAAAAIASSVQLAMLTTRVAALESSVASARLGGGADATPPATAAPDGVELDLREGDTRGSLTAPVVIVEFSDFECPFCAKHWRETLPRLYREYVSTGQVRYTFRHFPLENIHPHAFGAAAAAECARRQGRFWPVHDRLFANQRTLAADDLIEHVEAVGVDVPVLRRCIEGDATEQVRADQVTGRRVGARGTPMFVIGRLAPSGRVRAVQYVNGAQPFDVFKKALDFVIGESRTPSSTGMARIGQ